MQDKLKTESMQATYVLQSKKLNIATAKNHGKSEFMNTYFKLF